jgi:hypothetical protein
MLDELVKEDALTSAEIGRRIGIPMSNASKHMLQLKRCGLVTRGYGNVYRIPTEFRDPGGTGAGFRGSGGATGCVGCAAGVKNRLKGDPSRQVDICYARIERGGIERHLAPLPGCGRSHQLSGGIARSSLTNASGLIARHSAPSIHLRYAPIALRFGLPSFARRSISDSRCGISLVPLGSTAGYLL